MTLASRADQKATLDMLTMINVAIQKRRGMGNLVNIMFMTCEWAWENERLLMVTMMMKIYVAKTDCGTSAMLNDSRKYEPRASPNAEP